MTRVFFRRPPRSGAGSRQSKQSPRPWRRATSLAYREAIQAYADIITLDPAVQESYGVRGLAYYGLDDLKNARSSCESKPDHWAAQWCLAVVYDPGLVLLETDPLMDPLRNEPRFQAIERQLKFPS